MAVARVTVSSPVPPVMVSVLATVAVLAKLPSVKCRCLRRGRSEPLVMAVASVMVSLPEPPIRV